MRRTSWSLEHAKAESAGTMAGIHGRCEEVAERHGPPGANVLGANVLGANVVGFERVCDAMLARGLS